MRLGNGALDPLGEAVPIRGEDDRRGPVREIERIGDSINSLPASPSLAEVTASTEPSPAVQLKTTSPKEAASAKSPELARSPADSAHCTAFSLGTCREPMRT
jgi:hypothetical protein